MNPSIAPSVDDPCPCYGCSIERQRAGISSPDRSGEPCAPVEACGRGEACWTHSAWVDEAACDPPGACGTRIACAAHEEARA